MKSGHRDWLDEVGEYLDTRIYEALRIIQSLQSWL